MNKDLFHYFEWEYRYNLLMTFQYFCFSIRAMYGIDDQQNAVHGSDGYHNSEREIRFMFPDSKLIGYTCMTNP